jgi:hypothetical protein
MKQVVEQCLALNVNDLVHAGVFKAPIGTPCYCKWSDTVTGQELWKVNFHLETSHSLLVECTLDRSRVLAFQRIRLTPVPCHLGGARRMFLCPGNGNGVQCGRRASKLYLLGGRWVCRTCGDLTYVARQQHDKRKDALIRTPMALALALRSGNHRQWLLGIGALGQAITRLSKQESKCRSKGYAGVARPENRGS